MDEGDLDDTSFVIEKPHSTVRKLTRMASMFAQDFLPTHTRNKQDREDARIFASLNESPDVAIAREAAPDIRKSLVSA